MIRATYLIWLFCALTMVGAQTEPVKTVSSTDATSHVARSVEPIIPPLATAGKIGGKVKLHVIISPSGDVSSVAVMRGHPLLVQSAINAVKQWKYRPFLEGETAVSVATDVELDFSSSMSEAETAVRNKFFPIVDECRSLLHGGKYSEAEPKCREAVEISNSLPNGVVLERSDARCLLANSIFLQRRFSEAIPLYEEALELDKGYRKPDDADLATDYENLGRAYGVTGELAKADELYATAVKTFRGAIQTLPQMNENYSRQLKWTLDEYAELKDAEGQAEAASDLRKQENDIEPTGTH